MRYAIAIILSIILISGCSTTAAPGSSTTNSDTLPVYSVGERGVAGNIAYTIGDMSETDEVGGKETSGKYVLIEITAENVGKDPVTVNEWNFVLIDGRGRKFDTFSQFVSFGMDRFADTINPGLSKTATVVFETPADAEVFAIAARDSTLGRSSDYIIFEF